MTNNLRKEVLNCYKSLLKTRNFVFNGDPNALSITLNKIREEFKKNRMETNEEKIRELLTIGTEAEVLLRKTIIQAKLNSRGNYELKIRNENLDMDHRKQN